MGTPEFSVPTLQILLELNYTVQAVVSQPDRPKGRGRKIVPPPVKVIAEQHGLPVLQPKNVRTPEFQQTLREFAPEAIVVVAYGQILPESILKIPGLGCINIHASLLPKYRGAAPIQWAIIRGEAETGVTTMLMDKGMDTGNMLLQQSVPIAPDETAGTLHDKLSRIGATLLLQTLQGLEKGIIIPIVQDHEAATYAPLFTKEDGRIDWHQAASQINNKVRGLFPWPGAYTRFRGKLVKILKSRVEQYPHRKQAPNDSAPGTVVALDNAVGPLIATGDGGLRILEIQPENKRPMPCSDFCRGYHLAVGEKISDV